jgi:hypothetical protein
MSRSRASSRGAGDKVFEIEQIADGERLDEREITGIG